MEQDECTLICDVHGELAIARYDKDVDYTQVGIIPALKTKHEQMCKGNLEVIRAPRDSEIIWRELVTYTEEEDSKIAAEKLREQMANSPKRFEQKPTDNSKSTTGITIGPLIIDGKVV